MSDTSIRIKVGITIDSDNLKPFSQKLLQELEEKINNIIRNMYIHSGNPEELMRIVKQLETYKLQIEDVAVANHEYQLYVSNSLPQQEENNGVEENND